MANETSLNGAVHTNGYVGKLKGKIDLLRTGLMSAKDEKERLLKHLDDLNDSILRTEGAIIVLQGMVQEEEAPAETPPIVPTGKINRGDTDKVETPEEEPKEAIPA